jgi:hypothetical protein
VRGGGTAVPAENATAVNETAADVWAVNVTAADVWAAGVRAADVTAADVTAADVRALRVGLARIAAGLKVGDVSVGAEAEPSEYRRVMGRP